MKLISFLILSAEAHAEGTRIIQENASGIKVRDMAPIYSCLKHGGRLRVSMRDTVS